MFMTWDGPQAGSVSLPTAEDGMVDVTLGDFSTPTVRFTIVDVSLAGHVYRPDLNEGPASILVEGPG